MEGECAAESDSANVGGLAFAGVGEVVSGVGEVVSGVE